jgi:predicted TIM-barrel fold metal-dependent hydrolase
MKNDDICHVTLVLWHGYRSDHCGVCSAFTPAAWASCEHFRRNVWVSADPDEKSLPAMIDLCGSDRFFWATDFPHPDHTGNYIEELEEFGNKMSDPQRRREVLGDNVRRVYNFSI